MLKIINSGRVDNRNWWVELESGKVWNFKRREYLDVNGNPVYEIYPPYSDIEHGLPVNTDIGRRNNRKKCYTTNGAGMVENINDNTQEVSKNHEVQYILEKFYKGES